jgi:hypothetical protein
MPTPKILMPCPPSPLLWAGINLVPVTTVTPLETVAVAAPGPNIQKTVQIIDWRWF